LVLKGIETSFQVLPLLYESFHFWASYITFCLKFLKIPSVFIELIVSSTVFTIILFIHKTYFVFQELEADEVESDVDIEECDSECELQVIRLLQAASDNLRHFYVNPDCALHCQEEMKRKARVLHRGAKQQQKSPEPPILPPPVRKKTSKKKPSSSKKPAGGKQAIPKKVPAKAPAPDGQKISAAPEGVPKQGTPTAGIKCYQIKSTPNRGMQVIQQGMQVVQQSNMLGQGMQTIPRASIPSQSITFQIKATPSPGMQGFQRTATPTATPPGVGFQKQLLSSPDLKSMQVDHVTMQVIQAMGVSPSRVVSIQKVNNPIPLVQDAETPTKGTPLSISQVGIHHVH
jgi:hypothetical protein